VLLLKVSATLSHAEVQSVVTKAVGPGLNVALSHRGEAEEYTNTSSGSVCVAAVDL
jgi:hypothetical protein